jgi:hydroxyacyl-ACP dehydratase HTD2-like protein with hotdog domain
MLSVLRCQLKAGEEISAFSYRNLAPLYAEEELKVCVRKDTHQKGRFEVWIEGRDGGYAVKGTATVITRLP